MKAILAIALAAALLGGCSKSNDTSTATDTSSPAADAGTSATAAASAEATAEATAEASAETSATESAGATSTATAAAGGGSIDLPVYPHATEQTDKGLSISTGATSVKMDVYLTKEASKTVIDWYKSHLPSAWQNFVVSNNGKTAATFTSPSASGSKSGGAEQSVMVTEDTDGTRIQLTTKKGN